MCRLYANSRRKSHGRRLTLSDLNQGRGSGARGSVGNVYAASHKTVGGIRAHLANRRGRRKDPELRTKTQHNSCSVSDATRAHGYALRFLTAGETLACFSGYSGPRKLQPHPPLHSSDEGVKVQVEWMLPARAFHVDLQLRRCLN